MKDKSNLKLDLKSAKEYEELFNEVTSERDDIQEDLSDTIYDLQKEIERLKEENKKFIINGGYVGEGCANYMAAKLKDDLIIKLREENEKLKEEISNLQDTEKSFEIIQNITEELCDKETRIMDLEKQLKNTQEENKQNYEDKILLGIYKELYEDSKWAARIHEIMDYFDDRLDEYGDDKYRLYKRSLELHGIGENGFFDENELRAEYEEIKAEDPADSGLRCIIIEDIIDDIEISTGDQYYELNVDKPDGTRVWVKY